ncbi:hypothetical protein HOY80DRAFT_149664 [Tuber brumale]|nr:hypothetical protein HOY80DRAFT_149664 [Tuber brumale]
MPEVPFLIRNYNPCQLCVEFKPCQMLNAPNGFWQPAVWIAGTGGRSLHTQNKHDNFTLLWHHHRWSTGADNGFPFDINPAAMPVKSLPHSTHTHTRIHTYTPGEEGRKKKACLCRSLLLPTSLINHPDRRRLKQARMQASRSTPDDDSAPRASHDMQGPSLPHILSLPTRARPLPAIPCNSTVPVLVLVRVQYLCHSTNSRTRSENSQHGILLECRYLPSSSSGGLHPISYCMYGTRAQLCTYRAILAPL